MKLVSFLSVIGFLAKLIDILRRSAPGAAKFVNPDALSFKDGSSSALTKSSWTSSPIRKVGNWVYWVNIKVSFCIWQNIPRTKYTPSPIDIAVPKAFAPKDNVLANGSFAAITVVP